MTQSSSPSIPNTWQTPVSVILPFYNRAWSLKRAIDSVLAQSHPTFELILIDDGSSDDSLKTIAYALNDSRVKLISQENKGVSSARNIGVKNSNSPFIAFIDSDDQWHKEKLKSQLEFFNQNPDYLINQTQEIWIRDGVRVNPPKRLLKQQGDLFEISLGDCMITPSSVIFKKELWEEIGGFDESFPACEDYELWLRITANHKVGLINKNLLTRYGGHEDQLSSKYPQMDKFRVVAIDKLLSQHNLTEQKRALATEVFKQKYQILEKGAKKHNNTEILNALKDIKSIEKPYTRNL